jgi:hypothetical protein
MLYSDSMIAVFCEIDDGGRRRDAFCLKESIIGTGNVICRSWL